MFTRLRTLLFALVFLLWSITAEAKILLTGTSDLVQVITASGVTTIYVHASWADITTTALTPGRTNTQIATAATTTVVGSPAASTQRQVKILTIRNSHASSSNAITVQHTDGTTIAELLKYTLLAGETLQYTDDDGFRVIDASGQIKSLIAANSLPLPTGASTSALQGGGLPAALGAGGGLKVDGSGTALPVSGTVTVGTFPDNEPFNVAQINGVTPLMGNGVTGTGSPRVTIASDNTAFTVNIGTFPDNEPINLAQINGVTPLMGAGNTGTGSPRVTIASDQVSIPVAATLTTETTKVIGTARVLGNAGAAFDAATGAAPPANAVLVGGLVGGATGGFMGGIPVCDTVAVVNVSTATTTLIVTGVSGRHVRICALELVTAAANNVAFISGTGATCGTGTAGMGGGTTAASGYNFAANGGIAHGNGIGTVKKTVVTGDSVCLVTSAATQLSGSVSYVIY